jgi:2-polyprenyl-6-methoxyphenol hydroxylase-like FAD-dependent oxidoreductase
MYRKSEFDVCVVGAGPVGLTLSLDLAKRGVNVALLDKELGAGPWPKMERCNARSMEIYRRLGLHEEIRRQGQLESGSMSVAVVTRLSDPPLAWLEYPTVTAMRERITITNDGSLPCEPYQLISQYTLEPLLRQAVERCSEVTTFFGCEFEGFSEQNDHVSVRCRGAGDAMEINARYLVGCDGATSPIRKQLGIALQGRGGIGRMHQVFFRSDNLLDRIPIARARHYWIADEHGSAIIVQDDGKHFSLHSTLPAATDFAKVVRDIAGYDLDIEILHVGDWTMHLLLAESYGRDRIWLAGDAAHLVIPTGGLGMNTGVGDATDLSWKLACTIQGWGGPGLLKSYGIERRAVGKRNVEAAGFAAAGLAMWRNAWQPNIRDDSMEGVATRADLGRLANIAQRRSHEMNGVELGYTYAGSPIVVSEAEPYPESDFFHYLPTASPGSRFPHVKLKDGRALQDVLGSGFSLLVFDDTDTEPLHRAMAIFGAALETFRLDEPSVRAIAARNLVLLRPDLHVAWRGDSFPDSCEGLVVTVTGGRRCRISAAQ